MERKFFILGLCLLVFMCISAASANDNITNVESDASLDGISLPVNDVSNDSIIEKNDDLLSVNINDSDKLEATKSISTTITMSSVTVDEGNSFTFIAHVKASNGMTVPGNVTFKYGNEFSKALDKGSAKITYKGTLSPGKYTWTATYGGGKTTSGSTTYKFLTSKTTCKLTVYGNAILTADNFNSFYQSGEKYQIKVTNSYSNKGVSNKKIKILLYNDLNTYTTSYCYTDEKGICEGTVDSTPGSYSIVASIEDTYFKSNTLSFDVSIDKKPVILNSNQITGVANSYTTLKVRVKDTLGNPVEDGAVIFTVNGNALKAKVSNGLATKKIKLAKGTYNCDVAFYNKNSYSDSTSFKIVINKANVKLTPYKWIAPTKKPITLKTIVKDSAGNKINEGSVKFSINGKTYKTNVKNGLATKKIKINKAKTFKYKATFSGKNYNTKTASSKVYVKPTKEYYTFKYGKLIGKISYKQYSKLLDSYNNGKYKEISVKTGKYNTYKVPAYKTVKVTKNVWKYKNVLRSEYWRWDEGSEWQDYDTWEKYTKKGWTWYGTSDKEKKYSDGSYYSAHYYKLKKKVQVTETKKVRNGYKNAEYSIRMVVASTEGYNGFSIEFYDSHDGYLGGGLKNII